MHLARPSLLVALGFSVGRVLTSPHGQAHGPRRRYNDDASTTKDDLALVTNAPGPPTIQPGIPALQPSIPTTGVASLDIPPAQQTSSWRSVHPSVPPVKDPQPSNPVLTSSLAAISSSSNTSPVSASVSGPATTSTSIPFLSELMSQLASQPLTTKASSIYAPTLVSNSAASESESPRILSKPGATSGSDPILPTGSYPETVSSPVSTPSMLTYSFTLPPYSNGLDTSGIVESWTRISPAEDKDKPSATVYSYNLPPYTPKIPTYVATSAGTAPVDMTSGAPGSPGGVAPTNRIFLQQGFVDPTKDPVAVTSSMVPVYSPACLGNAYGGGYVITPTLSLANTNATGIAKIPPAYGFSYKFEPTVSPGYGGAVVIMDTKAPVPTVSSQPSPGLPSKDVVYSSLRATQSVGADSETLVPLKDATSTGNLTPHVTPGVTQASGAVTGSHPSAKDEPINPSGPSLLSNDAPPVNTPDHVSIPTGSIMYGMNTQDISISSLGSGSLHPSRSSAGIPPLEKDRPTASPAVPASTLPTDTIGLTLSGSGISTPLPVSTKSLGAYGGPTAPSKDIRVTTPGDGMPTTARDSPNSNVAGPVPLSTAVTGSGDLVNGDMNNKDAYSIHAGVTSSTALGAVTISRSTSTKIVSAVATVLPQGEYQKAAVAFDSTVTDAYGTVSAQRSSSKINSTFLLSNDESGVTPFQGKSARLTASVVMVFTIIFFVCLLSGYA
ncbi:MAG: hypothetical protein L6R36_002963 [Xanthoria steineri]|nr:MAG: hypothetical protein L6R36_002963 [Xanthoria steineri]